MKRFVYIFLGVLLVACLGAGVERIIRFNQNQFTAGHSPVSLKDGVLITNMAVFDVFSVVNMADPENSFFQVNNSFVVANLPFSAETAHFSGICDFFTGITNRGWYYGNGALTNVGDAYFRGTVFSGTNILGKSFSVTTTDATQTTLGSIAVPLDKSVTITAEITVKQASGANAGGYAVRAVGSNNGGTTAIVGSALVTEIAESAGISASTVTIQFDDAADEARVRVTGIAATTLKWNCIVSAVFSQP